MSFYDNIRWEIKAQDSRGSVSPLDAQLAVLMDIRRELQDINSKLNCYRIPRALDALIELGVKSRRDKRKRRKSK